MSSTFEDDIEAMGARLAWMKEVRRRFPDARVFTYKDDEGEMAEVIVSAEAAQVADCLDILGIDTGEKSARYRAFICPCVRVKVGRYERMVYVAGAHGEPVGPLLHSVLGALQRKHPETHKQIVASIVEGKLR